MRIIIFRDSMKSALQRGISYLEAVENKKRCADVMAELTEEEEENQESMTPGKAKKDQ
jgi:hypothetical protein